MKLGLGLYRHMLAPKNYRFARQCGCTHVVVHYVDYFNQGEGNDRDNQPTGGPEWVGTGRRSRQSLDTGGVVHAQE
jgi:mannonate dehydratase